MALSSGHHLCPGCFRLHFLSPLAPPWIFHASCSHATVNLSNCGLPSNCCRLHTPILSLPRPPRPFCGQLKRTKCYKVLPWRRAAQLLPNCLQRSTYGNWSLAVGNSTRTSLNGIHWALLSRRPRPRRDDDGCPPASPLPSPPPS